METVYREPNVAFRELLSFNVWLSEGVVGIVLIQILLDLHNAIRRTGAPRSGSLILNYPLLIHQVKFSINQKF